MSVLILIVAGLLDPIRLLFNAIAVWRAKSPWWILYAAIASSILMEILLAVLQTLPREPALFVTGFLASLVQAAVIYLLRLTLRKKSA